jgi:hypothetical protein
VPKQRRELSDGRSCSKGSCHPCASTAVDGHSPAGAAPQRLFCASGSSLIHRQVNMLWASGCPVGSSHMMEVRPPLWLARSAASDLARIQAYVAYREYRGAEPIAARALSRLTAAAIGAMCLRMSVETREMEDQKAIDRYIVENAYVQSQVRPPLIRPRDRCRRLNGRLAGYCSGAHGAGALSLATPAALGFRLMVRHRMQSSRPTRLTWSSRGSKS